MCSISSINENSLPEWETALDRAEETMRRISGQCRLQKTGHPDVFCSTLPSHWRSNKSLPTPFVVLAFFPVQDGTRVCISAGNDENYCADVKNNMAEFNGQLARFSDLRFVGKSGRGKNFNLSITIFTQPHSQLIIVPNVVKVTVDGPRDSRNASKYLNGQYIPIPKRIRPGSGLEHFPNQIGRKNCTENRRCSSNNSTKIHHPSVAPASNFLISPHPTSTLPSPFLPHGLPMAAALGGLFPRLVNGQLAGKIGGSPPINLPANFQAAMNVRQPMLGIAGFGHGLRMPTLMAPNSTDSAQISPNRLFVQFAGHPPPSNPFPQIGQSAARLSLFSPIGAAPILNESLQAAISAAVASASAVPPSSIPSSLFPSPIVSNPAAVIQAMAAGLFANAPLIADKFGSTSGRRDEEIGRRERNGQEEEMNSKANCEPSGSSPDEGHCSEESREEEGDNVESQNCNPRGSINERKRRSRSSEAGIEGEKEARKRVKREEEDENGQRLVNSGDGGNNKVEELMPWGLALKKQRKGAEDEGRVAHHGDRPNPNAHSAAALWRPFHPC